MRVEARLRDRNIIHDGHGPPAPTGPPRSQAIKQSAMIPEAPETSELAIRPSPAPASPQRPRLRPERNSISLRPIIMVRMVSAGSSESTRCIGGAKIPEAWEERAWEERGRGWKACKGRTQVGR